MLLVDENHVGASTSTHTNGKMLYREEDRPRGRGGRGGLALNGGSRNEQNEWHNRTAGSNSEPSESRGVITASEAGKRRSHRMLVLWQERPQGERVLEETS